ncbi:MAG: VC0807 family protein [Nocardioidaceae bacterium]
MSAELGAAAEIVVELAQLRPSLARAGRLLLEAAVIPTALLYVFMHSLGLVAGLAAVLSWCALTVVLRWVTQGRVPPTLLLAVGMLAGRASLALLLSSAYVYLLQPVLGSILMAALFVGSAACGRPVTIRLARDFVTLPGSLFDHHGVRRMFTQVCLMWGGSRLLDAAMSIAFLRWGVDAGLMSRGVLSGCLTVLSVAGCAAWGWSRLRRIPGVTFRMT